MPQEFNKGLFDYLIAADDPTKGPGRPAAAPEPTAKRSKKRPRLDDSASGKDAASVKAQDDSFEFGVTRGIDFKVCGLTGNTNSTCSGLTGCNKYHFASYPLLLHLLLLVLWMCSSFCLTPLHRFVIRTVRRGCKLW